MGGKNCVLFSFSKHRQFLASSKNWGVKKYTEYRAGPLNFRFHH